MKYRTNKLYQKTALANGFIASIGSKPISIPQVKVCSLYHKKAHLSNTKKRLRGPDGIRTRTFYLGGDWSTINLPAQFTEAQLLSQILIKKGISQNGS